MPSSFCVCRGWRIGALIKIESLVKLQAAKKSHRRLASHFPPRLRGISYKSNDSWEKWLAEPHKSLARLAAVMCGRTNGSGRPSGGLSGGDDVLRLGLDLHGRQGWTFQAAANAFNTASPGNQPLPSDTASSCSSLSRFCCAVPTSR